MNIVVCLKQVPGTTEVKIDPQTNTLIRQGIENIINPFDTYAIEEAVRLKEKHGGRVTVITMGPPQAEAALREAISSAPMKPSCFPTALLLPRTPGPPPIRSPKLF